jgi:tRNA threonylcarbamoyladenosine biosynthesis protein TsaE
MLNWQVESLDALKKVSLELAEQIQEPVILFKGNMGAGKTTLIKVLCRVLGVEDEVSSPTFSIVNEYWSEPKGKVFHFDFYRLEDEDEAYEFGFEEYLYSGNICLVEWPEKISNLLPEKFGLIEIDENDGTRSIKFTPSTTILP